MNTMKSLILVLACTVVLSGCTSSMVALTPSAMEAAGIDIDSGVHAIADASVLKELAVHKTLQNRDSMIAAATSNAGFKSEWKSCDRTVFYPGMVEPLLVTEPCLQVSYTPMPEFNQELPTSPSIHPGYKMTENIVKSVANATLIGYGINTLGNVLDAGFSSVGNNYSGSTYNQSFNPGNNNSNVGSYHPEVVDTETLLSPIVGE